MSTKDTIDRAYGNVPKECTPYLDFRDIVPEFRGIRYFLILAIRRIKKIFK